MLAEVSSVAWEGEGRAEFAGDEGVEGAEAVGKFVRGQAALAMEEAEKIGGRATALEGVAFDAAGDEVAVGIVLDFHARDDVIEAAHLGGEPALTIEAPAAFAGMDGAAQSAVLEEVQLLEGVSANGDQRTGGEPAGANGGNFRGQAHVHNVARDAALDENQDAARDEAADGPAHGIGSQASATSEPRHGKAEANLSFEAAVTEKMSINNAIRDGKVQTRDNEILELFPDQSGVDFFGFDGGGFHDGMQTFHRELKSRKQEKTGLGRKLRALQGAEKKGDEGTRGACAESEKTGGAAGVRERPRP